MITEIEKLPLTDNEAHHRFELSSGGHTAYIEYRRKGDKVFLIHTEVPAAMSGRAVGSVLVEKVFSHLEEMGLRMVPYCPFVRAYLKKHPEWERLRP